MSELDAIAAALSARVAPGVAGTLLTFRVDDVWLTMTGRLAPHLELSLPAPELVGLRLRLQLGVPTLLGGAGLDERWDVRTSDLGWAGRLLDEAPWPTAPAPRRHVVEGFVRTVVQYLTYGLSEPADMTGAPPPPRYVLEVTDGVATIERRTSEVDQALAVGAAQRLVQLVTRTARRQRAEAEAARRAPPQRRGPYR